MTYSLIVPIYWDTESFLNWNLDYLYKGTKAKHIYLVGPKAMETVVPKREYVSFIDGNTIVDGMTKEAIYNCIESVSEGSGKRAGWYFQQFIKMGWALHCNDEYYAVMDLDTIPRNIVFFKDEKPVFYVTKENHKEYFETLDKLIPGIINKYGKISFVNQFMIFNKSYMIELLDLIRCSGSNGGVWWQKIISSISPSYISKAGFSEFETYGNYVMGHYPDSYYVEQLEQCRSAAAYLSMTPKEDMIKWALKSYDTLTVEKWSYSPFWFFLSKVLYKKIDLKSIAYVHDGIAKPINQFKYHLKKMRK